MRLIFLIFLFLISCQTPQKTKTVLPVMAEKYPSSIRLQKTALHIDYYPEYKIPLRVRYKLTEEMVRNKNAKRKDKFFADPELKARKVPHALPTDYVRTGYDRGHMAPSEDFISDQALNDETFVMTNMAPQVPGLNRGAWAQLEALVRRWACGEKFLVVEVGPIDEVGLSKLPSGVVVPKRFYKVVLDKTPPVKAIAFIYSQGDFKVSPAEKSMSVSDLETLTKVAYLEGEVLDGNVKSTSDISKWAEKDCSR